VINSEAGKRCRSDERGLNWRQRGPRGPRGLQGIQGEQGEQGIPGTGSSSVAYLSASSGEWRSGVPHHLVDHGARINRPHRLVSSRCHDACGRLR
jgi:hypothetical protein